MIREPLGLVCPPAKKRGGAIDPPQFHARLSDMDIAYFKRFRMEIRPDRAGSDARRRAGPLSFSAVGRLVPGCLRPGEIPQFPQRNRHRGFPCLAEFDGCRRLMAEIAGKPGFLPEATWLVVCRPADKGTVPFSA